MRKYVIGIIGVLVVWNIFLTFTMINLEIKNKTNTENTSSSVQQQTTEIESDFTKLISKSESKVVGINTTYNGIAQNSGSGAVYQVNEGNIIVVTSAEVIANSNQFFVRFVSGETREGTLLGFDEATDIAVLQVPINFDLEPFKLGDSSTINVGEWVISIGNPESFSRYGTVEIGIITGKYKGIALDTNGDGSSDYQLMTFQTNINIHSGIIGGPVINMAGELVGINTTKWSSGIASEDTTVVPINEIVFVVTEIIEKSAVSRSVLGFADIKVVKEMPIYLKNQLGIRLDLESGLLIGSVFSGSLIEEAGIKPGDILWQMDGEDIQSYKQYQKIIYSKESGDSFDISYLRGGTGNPIVIKVTIP